MKVYNDIQQGTEEWLKLRRGKFTASDAQAIGNNGKGLETLIYEKAAEVITGNFKEQYTNPDIERGNELEELARNSYELETGITVIEAGFVELNEWVGCSPDGLVQDDGLVEFKCKNDVNFLKFLLDEKIDPSHEWQMHMQMYVCERKWCDYVVYNPNFPKPLSMQRVIRDNVKIEKIVLGLEKAQKDIASILKSIQGGVL